MLLEENINKHTEYLWLVDLNRKIEVKANVDN